MKNVPCRLKGLMPACTLLVLLTIAFAAEGQSFTSVPVAFPDAGRSAVAWGDMDNDGDLDLFISGQGTDGEPLAHLYANDQGTFSLYGSFPGYEESAAAWGDFDHDGDLDLLLAGKTEAGDRTVLFRNDDGDFIETDPGMAAVEGGDVSWMDVDGDGDLDAFITGSWKAEVYINDGGTFSELGFDFGLFSSASADWGDFDNDGDLDLLINGDSGAGAVTDIFRNDNGTFTRLDLGLPGLMAGATNWVDYDMDGDLDFSIAGNDDALEAQCFIFRNDGHENFTRLDLILDGFSIGEADWGDFDNDGDLDMLYSGKCTGCGVSVSGINRNDGDDAFYPMTYLFPSLIRCSLQSADFDNDGDLDFVIAGTTYSGTPTSHLYRNDAGANAFSFNTGPSVPQGLVAEVLGDHVHLSWEKSADDHTVQDAISYNLRLGSSSEGEEIVPAMAMPGDGFRKIPAIGNTRLMNSWRIENLLPGTYYWSVQAIDQGYLGSGFADEQSFTVTVTQLDDISAGGELRVHPNPAHSTITLSGRWKEKYSVVKIFDLSGRCHLSQPISPSTSSMDVSSLRPGFYVLELQGGKLARSLKLIIE